MTPQLFDAIAFVFGITACACALIAIDAYETRRRRHARFPAQPRVQCPACGTRFRLGDNGRTVTCSVECATDWNP